MAVNANGYTIFRSDGTTAIEVPKGDIDTQFSVPLIGQNATPYGDSVAQSTVHMLENFASENPPLNVIPGQLWCYKSRPDGEAPVTELYFNVGENDGDGAGTLEIDDTNWDRLLTTYTRLSSDLGDGTEGFAKVIYANHFVANGGLGDPTGDPTNGSAPGMFVGTATSAEYADIAERFHADGIYESGTIVKLGGTNEVTMTTTALDLDVIGVVSTNPAYMMNASAGDNETHPYIALAGRVPTKVVGSIQKGQRIVSSQFEGVAKAVDKSELHLYNPFQIIGRALESNDDSGVKLVMVVVGVK